MTEETALKKKKFECLEDLEIGSVMAKKLRELGFNTVENLAMATPKELEQAGIVRKNAKKLIRKARSS
ncbi:DNA repair and recombination protein RadA, partial [Candidatus Bathyarchaeota archaeon]|nr:DNA repair and recombination protein RadA [Candidatus Bathyarchaeota archaeon]